MAKPRKPSQKSDIWRDFPKTAGSWVMLGGATALIISAIILGFMDGREGVVADFLLNAGLFLGIQRFGSVASERVQTKYGSCETEEYPALEPTPDGPPTHDPYADYR